MCIRDRHILYHDDVSGFKIGWIILILQLPVMGGLLDVYKRQMRAIVRIARRRGRHTARL